MSDRRRSSRRRAPTAKAKAIADAAARATADKAKAKAEAKAKAKEKANAKAKAVKTARSQAKSRAKASTQRSSRGGRAKPKPVPWAGLSVVLASTSVLGVFVPPPIAKTPGDRGDGRADVGDDSCDGHNSDPFISQVRAVRQGVPVVVVPASGKGGRPTLSSSARRLAFNAGNSSSAKRKRGGGGGGGEGAGSSKGDHELRKRRDAANEEVVQDAKAKLAAWLHEFRSNPQSWTLGPEDNWCRYCGAARASSFGVRVACMHAHMFVCTRHRSMTDVL